jgi:hypothetical protein
MKLSNDNLLDLVNALVIAQNEERKAVDVAWQQNPAVISGGVQAIKQEIEVRKAAISRWESLRQQFEIELKKPVKAAKVTEKERILLEAIYNNEFQDGRKDEANNAVWVNCLSVPFAATSIGGVMTSLSKKGLAGTDGEACWLTQSGIDLLKTFGK